MACRNVSAPPRNHGNPWACRSRILISHEERILSCCVAERRRRGDHILADASLDRRRQNVYNSCTKERRCALVALHRLPILALLVETRASTERNTLQGETTMPFYERGDVRIHYEEVGSGFPLMIIPGGGLNSTVVGLATHPFNPMEEFKDEYRCIAADLRNANGGQSTGPLEIDRPWDAYADDHLGLMTHLGISEFLVLGFCIGGPFIWNLFHRAPERVVAAVLAQPSGFRPEMPDLFYQHNIKGWGPALCARRLDVTMDMVHDFFTSMYTTRADFVFTVTRDFV